MPVVKVEEIIDVPRSAFFDVISDHARYDRFPGIRGAELLQPGHEEKNGVGAVRRIRLSGPMVLDEEIVAYEAPTGFSYRIIRVRPLPVRHEIGIIELTELSPERTKVLWTSTFEVPLPIVGGLIGKQVVRQFTQGFRAIIFTAAKLARS